MARSSKILIIVSLLLVVSIIASTIVLQTKAYLLVSFAVIACILFIFFLRFELRSITGREIVLLAMLSAIAAVARVPFAPIPSVQPTSFVIILVGLVFGAESGFLVGAIAALVSNIFLGQGPWTPWQMLAWGMMGASAGLLRNTWLMKKMWGLSLFGFVWGLLFGWFMNLWIIVSHLESLSWGYIIGVYSSSIYFDLAHSLSNIFFLIVFASSWRKVLERFRKKYGLLKE